MTRTDIRELKRKVVAGMRRDATEADQQAARQAAVVLLRRSIAMKHDRLALLRLVDALKLGAAIDPPAWRYCTAIARAVPDIGDLRDLHPSLPTLVQQITVRC